MNYYFKKTCMGMILMKEKSIAADYPGSWYNVWVRADEEESQRFLTELHLLIKDKELLDKIKEDSPELLI